MQIKIEDMKKLYNKLKQENKIIRFDINKLKLINSHYSFTDIDTNENIIRELNIVKTDINGRSKIPNSQISFKFFDFYDTIDIDTRKGSMSFSLCSNEHKLEDFYDSMYKKCKQKYAVCDCVQPNDNDISATVSLNPKYYNFKYNKSFGRISYYVNKLPLHIYNFSSENYKNRYLFRNIITKLILGDDFYDVIFNFNFKPEHGFFKDYTIGQEVYYYFLEKYNYSRHSYLLNSYNKFVSNFNKDIYEEFYNNEEINNEYPPIDGVLYFDHSIYDRIDYPGIECLIFNKENVTKIKGNKFAFDNTYYDSNSFVGVIDKFLIFIQNPTISTPIDNVCINFNTLQNLSKIPPLPSMSALSQNSVGGYYNKYLKYKHKYLELKNKL
jgi:hypothetical protein